MIRTIQFRPKPEMSTWLQQKADAGFRSVASIIQEIVAERMEQELNTKKTEELLKSKETTQ